MIPVAQPSLVGREAEFVVDCLTRGQLSGGGYVQRFERELADTCQVAHAAACCNGTAALHLAMIALDVRPGDEVLVPALTYVATANAVRYCGATPVFVDVEPGTWTMDALRAHDKLTPRTRGLIAVHLYGLPADMHALRQVSDSVGGWVVEDAAEAIGAQYHDASIGSVGDVTTLSFYGNKIITCGEGGAVLTPSTRLDGVMRLYRGQGVRTAGRYDHEVVGYNYRLGELQAAVGVAQIEQLWWHLTVRHDLVTRYREWAERAGLECQQGRPGTVSANWMFTMLVPAACDRDNIIAELRLRDIETRPAFPLVSQMPMYRDEEPYPVAADVARRGLTLPTHGAVSGAHFETITGAVEELCRRVTA